MYSQQDLTSYTDKVKPITLNCGGVNVEVNPGLFIDNQFVPSLSGKTFPTVDPSNEKVIANLYEASAEDVDLAVRAAEKAFENGSVQTSMSSLERGRLLQKLADLIRLNSDKLARIEALDNGKTFSSALAVDIPFLIDSFEYYAGQASKIYGQTMDINPSVFAYTRREPIGICGCILPQNFPLVMASWKLAPALATGNVVVLKTSEKTPLSALALAVLIREAGFPQGVVNIVSGYGKPTGEAISLHPKIRKVAFTGSSTTGKLVMADAARSNLKKVALELGGKSPNIIFDDCDLDHAVQQTFPGLFFNAGQSCTASTRIFVQEGVYEKFLSKFVEKMKTINLGDQQQKSTDQGPQVDKIQFDTVMRFIESGKKEGAKIQYGGERHGSTGYYIQPTIFTNVDDEMEICKKEIFGPVGCLLKFKTEEEAIRRANNSEYGLAAAVFTGDTSKAIRVSNALQAGTVWINQYYGNNIQTSFGGYKQSGIGREGGQSAIDLYTEVKQVMMNVNNKP